MPPTATSEMPLPMPLVDHLGQRDGHGVEHEARGGADQDEQRKHRDHHPHRQPNVGRGAAPGGELAVVRHHHEIGDPGRDADHGRHQERAAPADPCGQRRGDAGGKRDADIAADAVEGERPPAIDRGSDHDGGADRMIDRGEHAEREQRDGERDEIRRERRRGAAQPAADIEHHHHVAAAPAVGEPARRQREDAEGEERRGAEREQFAVGAAVNHLETDHHGREDQHHVVIDRVGEVVEADRQPPSRFIVQGLRAEKRHCDALGICRLPAEHISRCAPRSYADFEDLTAGSGRRSRPNPMKHMWFWPAPPIGQYWTPQPARA